MKLEDQVCTLEQAKKLKELGVMQESLFYWYKMPHTKGGDEYWETDEIAYNPWFVNASFPEDESEGDTYFVDGTEQYSAFTVAELGNLLPYRLRDEEKRENPHLRVYRGESHWDVEYHTTFSRPFVKSREYENLADAMAHVLIHLLMKNIITINEINPKSNF